MYDNEAEKDLKLRAGCPCCQAELEKSVQLYFAYLSIPPLDPSMAPLLDTMEEQAEILDALQERCCNGGN